jgi:cytochrome c553
MRKAILIVLTMCGVLSSRLSAQTASVPTWSSDVACIVYSHCSTCHNSAGIAPFSLLSYSDAFRNMYTMQHDVTIKKMPPYLPNTSYQKYADMHRLSDQEIQTISAWVAAGGPSGDTTLAPVAPVYTSNVVITNPDLTGRIPDYTIPNTGGDLYRCFIITPPAGSANFIKSIEVIPGDRSAVHHVLVFQDTASALLALDSADTGPGYTSFGGVGSSTAKLINGWVPGSASYTTPAGMGIKLAKDARIVVQIHYPIGSEGKLDSTRVNFKFDPTPSLRNVSLAPILNHQTSLTDGPLSIPAGSVRTFHEQFTLPAVNITTLSIAPHAHLVCKSLMAYAVTPVGDTIPLIDIPQWDFHWQGGHPFQKPIKIPASSTLYGVGVYDNTTNNPAAPSPPQTVSVGESTTDEMMLFYFAYLPYAAGDENIIIDTASHEAHYLNCVSSFVVDTTTGPNSIKETAGNSVVHIYPNPAQSILSYESPDEIKEISLTDLTGKTVKQITAPGMKGQINISDISSGLYFIKVQNQNGTSSTERFVKE